MKIYTIIVTYNGEDLIKKCLKSLQKSTIKIDIIIVDNASTDKTTEVVKNEFPEVRLIKSKKNEGFGRANNIAMRIALDENADYVVILNQDTEVFSDTIEKIINISIKNPELGIVSPLQLDADQNITALVYHWFLKSNKSFFDDAIMGELKDFYEIDFVSASFWLIPKKILLKVGGFNPMFFMYGEDGEYCYRVKNKNFKIGITPQSRYIHYKINFYKKTFKMQVLEVRNYFIEHSANIKYSFTANIRSAFRYVYTEIAKFLFLFKFKIAFAYILGALLFVVNLPKVYKLRKEIIKDQATFLSS